MLTVKETDTYKVSWSFYERDPETGEPDLTKPVDLTGATPVITIRQLKGRTVKEGFAADPIDFTSGVSVDENAIEWILPGTLVPGRYALLGRATKAGQQTTAPTSGVEILIVDPDLYDPEP